MKNVNHNYIRELEDLSELRAGDLLQHYKGGLYKIESVDAIHTETNEELVVYRPFVRNKHGLIMLGSSFWCRPKSMFNDMLEGGIPRFSLIGSTKEIRNIKIKELLEFQERINK